MNDVSGPVESEDDDMTTLFSDVPNPESKLEHIRNPQETVSQVIWIENILAPWTSMCGILDITTQDRAVR